MVAMTGGLFVSIAVFALARDGSRFYQRESRVAEATLGSVVGFDRLRGDIARAGYLSPPNLRGDSLRSDATFCGDVTQFNGLPFLSNLASIQINDSTDPEVTNNASLQSASPAIVPQEILLAGSYSSVERFDAIAVFQEGNQYAVRLQSARGALWRLNYLGMPSDVERTALLTQLFPVGRILRLYSTDSGTFQLGIITRAAIDNGAPTVYLSSTLALVLSGSAATRCNASTHQIVNVVNLIRYRLRNVMGHLTDSEYSGYKALFDLTNVGWENGRLELIREELDPMKTDAEPFSGTTEVIAEYAVDLRFGITYLQQTGTLKTLPFGTQNVTLVAGLTSNANATPQRVRSVRARLSVRSREADRDANVTTGESIAPGLYRIAVTSNEGKSAFARVRTQQADIFIGSHAEVTW
jgi:hypothetical protein